MEVRVPIEIEITKLAADTASAAKQMKAHMDATVANLEKISELLAMESKSNTGSIPGNLIVHTTTQYGSNMPNNDSRSFKN